MSDRPLIDEAAWSDGIWLRDRSGPRPRAITKGVEVTIWHRIRDLGGFEGRPRTVCGFGPRQGFVWPGGGLRWEVARPNGYGGLPGSVCSRCAAYPAIREEEREVLVLDEIDLDALAEKVAARLAEAQPGEEGRP